MEDSLEPPPDFGLYDIDETMEKVEETEIPLWDYSVEHFEKLYSKKYDPLPCICLDEIEEDEL